MFGVFLLIVVFWGVSRSKTIWSYGRERVPTKTTERRGGRGGRHSMHDCFNEILVELLEKYDNIDKQRVTFIVKEVDGEGG